MDDHATTIFTVAVVGLAVHYQWGGFLIGFTLGSCAMFVWYIVVPVLTSWAAKRRRVRRVRQ